MLWYQRSPGDTAMKLIGCGYSEFKDDSAEGPFRKHFRLTGDLGETKNGSLSIIDLKAAEHTATYFCAARRPQCVEHPSAPDKNLFNSKSGLKNK